MLPDLKIQPAHRVAALDGSYFAFGQHGGAGDPEHVGEAAITGQDRFKRNGAEPSPTGPLVSTVAMAQLRQRSRQFGLLNYSYGKLVSRM